MFTYNKKLNRVLLILAILSIAICFVATMTVVTGNFAHVAEASAEAHATVTSDTYHWQINGAVVGSDVYNATMYESLDVRLIVNGKDEIYDIYLYTDEYSLATDQPFTIEGNFGFEDTIAVVALKEDGEHYTDAPSLNIVPSLKEGLTFVHSYQKEGENSVMVVNCSDTSVVGAEFERVARGNTTLVTSEQMPFTTERIARSVTELYPTKLLVSYLTPENEEATVWIDNGTHGVVAQVESTVTDYAGGSGTAGDPYLIATKEQLMNLDSFAYSKLTSDIDLSGENWIPLTIYDEGCFNGSGFEINNLTISVSSAGNYGLFDTVYGRVQSFTVTGSINVTSLVWGAFIGGVAGTVESSGSLYGCASRVTINSSATINAICGGVVGQNDGSLRFCTYLGYSLMSLEIDGNELVCGSNSVGCIAGVNNKTIHQCTVLKTTVTLTKFALGINVGGFAGQNFAPGTITQCNAEYVKFRFLFNASGSGTMEQNKIYIGLTAGYRTPSEPCDFSTNTFKRIHLRRNSDYWYNLINYDGNWAVGNNDMGAYIINGTSVTQCYAFNYNTGRMTGN